MVHHWRLGAALCALGLGLGGAAQAQPAPPPIDYSSPATWLCRPGHEALCTTGLDAMAVSADGTRTPQPFQPAADPPIDCFYVYPTASGETSDYSDMTPDAPVEETTRGQAGRLTSRCRMFAPIYRQLTLPGLKRMMASGEKLDWTRPYLDVRDAWRWYMAHENHGRGVVLVGHSQGTILLQRLLSEEIDGKPVQRRLVSAFLAGDPGLPVPEGAQVGGALKSIPLCAAAAQTGCVYVWADYLADDTDSPRVFGRDEGGGMVAGCVNPAAPAGGSGELKTYLRRPSMAPSGDPPWVEVVGQLSAACTRDAGGDVLTITLLPSRYEDLLRAGLGKYRSSTGWGLHRLDLSLPQGNILDLLAAESASWTAR